MKITELQNFGHFPLLMLAVMRRDTETARTHLRPLQSWADDDDAQSRDSYLIGEAAVASIEGPPEEAVILATKAARSAYESNGLMSESFRLAWPLALETALQTATTTRRELSWPSSPTPSLTTFRPTSRHSGRDPRR
jgi:hypothetical protein